MSPDAPDSKERDYAWVRAFQAGDPSGFENLFKTYIKPVCHFVRKHGGLGEHEAEDLGHEIMIRAYKSLPRFVFQARFSTWLFTIALNQIRNQRRVQRPLSLNQAGDAETDRLDRLSSPGGRPDTEAMDRELRQVLDRGIARLPEKERSVFVLREYQDLSFQEIADITGQTLRNIQFIKERANRRMKDYLESSGVLPEPGNRSPKPDAITP